MLQYGGDQVCLGRLPARGIAVADLLTQRVEKQRADKANNRDKPQTPLVGEKPGGDDDGLYETARHDLEDTHRLSLDILERRGCGGRDGANLALIEEAHVCALEPLAYLKALLRAHIKAADGTAQRGAVGEHDLPRKADDHDRQRDPGSRRKDGTPGKAIEHLDQHDEDGHQRQRLEHCVEDGEDEREDERSPLLSRKGKQALE